MKPIKRPRESQLQSFPVCPYHRRLPRMTASSPSVCLLSHVWAAAPSSCTSCCSWCPLLRRPFPPICIAVRTSGSMATMYEWHSLEYWGHHGYSMKPNGRKWVFCWCRRFLGIIDIISPESEET